MDVLDRVSSRIPRDFVSIRLHYRRALFTLCVGIASFWLMPSSPSQTKTKHRPKGYFTEREEKIIVNRTIRDDPGKVCLIPRDLPDVVLTFSGWHAQPSATESQTHLESQYRLSPLAPILHLSGIQSTDSSGLQLSTDLIPTIRILQTHGQSTRCSQHTLVHRQSRHRHLGLRSGGQ